jgi:hypothetical protein
VATSDDRLGVSGSDVPVGRDDADVVRGAAHMEVLGDLLFVEETVVAAAHRLSICPFDIGRHEETGHLR